MNTPSPLIPQGSLLEQKNNSRARVKVAFFCVVGVHVVAILVALLAQGCRRDPAAPVVDAQPPVPAMDTNVPALDTNAPYASVDPNLPAPGTVATNVPANPAPDQLASMAQEHIVQKGESFSTIAPKYRVSVKALQAANPTVNPNRMQIGQKLIIPPATAGAVNGQPGGAALATGAGEQTYVVKAGDNLTKIAAQFGTTIAALKRANNLTTERILAGDKLKIPASNGTAAPR